MSQKTVYDLEGVITLETKGVAEKAKRVLAIIRKLGNAGKEITIGTRLDAGLTAPTKKAAGLYAELEQAKYAAEELEAALEKLKDAGGDPDTIEQYEDSLAQAQARAADLEDQLSHMNTYGKNGLFMDAVPASVMADVSANIARAKENIGEFGLRLRQVLSEGSPGFKRMFDAITGIRKGFNSAAYHATHFATGVINDAKGMLARLKQIPIVQKTISKLFGTMSKSANKIKGLGTMTLGKLVGFASIGALIAKGISMAKEGMVNLIAYDTRTANSVNMLKASLLTLKNAMATAFAPVLNAIAPILNTLINMLTRAATAVAHFMAAITGQKSVVVAKKITNGYSSSLGGTAKNAKKANKANKELQRTLLGFDQINRLEDPNKNAGAGGGGAGGGGAGGLSPGDMFQTVPIDSKISDFADKVKEAWKKADFTEIGAILATKLNNAMKAIPWKEIQTTCNNIAKSIATFINGFFETFDWKLLARTVSKGITTAMGMVSTFLETVHWQSLGKAIVKFITGIDWKGLFSGAARLIGNVAGAIFGFLVGAFKTAGKNIKNFASKFWKKTMKDAGGNVVKGFFLGIVRAVKGIAKWIKNNIFKPFINGFKKAFGISSPSKVMKEQGGYMIDGLLGGLKDKLGDILDWFKDLPGKIKDKIGDITLDITGNIGDLKDKAIDFTANLVGDGWNEIKNISGKTLQYLAEKVGNVWDTLTTTVKGIASYAAEKTGNVWNALSATVKGTASYAAEKAGKVWDSLNNTVKGTANYYAEKAGKTWDSLAKTLSGTVKYYAVKAGKTWKNLTKTLKGKVNFVAKKIGNMWNKLTGKGKASGGVYSGGRWRPVQSYEGGGFPSGSQLFVAREAGPELVGTMGSRTAVMNNDQIVASVSDGVARAMAEVMRGFENGGETTVVIQGDMAKFFRAVQQKAVDYTRTTGRPAFPV